MSEYNTQVIISCLHIPTQIPLSFPLFLFFFYFICPLKLFRTYSKWWYRVPISTRLALYLGVMEEQQRVSSPPAQSKVESYFTLCLSHSFLTYFQFLFSFTVTAPFWSLLLTLCCTSGSGVIQGAYSEDNKVFNFWSLLSFFPWDHHAIHLQKLVVNLRSFIPSRGLHCIWKCTRQWSVLLSFNGSMNDELYGFQKPPASAKVLSLLIMYLLDLVPNICTLDKKNIFTSPGLIKFSITLLKDKFIIKYVSVSKCQAMV